MHQWKWLERWAKERTYFLTGIDKSVIPHYLYQKLSTEASQSQAKIIYEYVVIKA